MVENYYVFEFCYPFFWLSVIYYVAVRIFYIDCFAHSGDVFLEHNLCTLLPCNALQNVGYLALIWGLRFSYRWHVGLLSCGLWHPAVFKWLPNFIRKYFLHFVVEDRDTGTLLITHKTVLLNNIGGQKLSYLCLDPLLNNSSCTRASNSQVQT